MLTAAIKIWFLFTTVKLPNLSFSFRSRTVPALVNLKISMPKPPSTTPGILKKKTKNQKPEKHIVHYVVLASCLSKEVFETTCRR